MTVDLARISGAAGRCLGHAAAIAILLLAPGAASASPEGTAAERAARGQERHVERLESLQDARRQPRTVVPRTGRSTSPMLPPDRQAPAETVPPLGQTVPPMGQTVPPLGQTVPPLKP